MYPRPFLIPDGNPYAEHSAGEYFKNLDPDERRRRGRGLGDWLAGRLGRTGRILELGCGPGEILNGLASAGWEARGVDMTPAYATATGVSIELSPVESASSLDEKWDVILLANIIEHLYDPRATVQRVRKALVPGGTLLVHAPNECSLWSRVGNLYMRIRGRDWAVNLSPTFPPYHVVGFCPASLKRLLEEAGFVAIEIQTPRWGNDLPVAAAWSSRIESLATEWLLTLGEPLGMGVGLACEARAPWLP